MSKLWALLTHLHALAGPVVMLLYPLYASVVAIESTSKLDDEQWLAYWILYSFLTLMEMLLQPILQCDCGMSFFEFLSDEINMPSNDFRSDYLRTRYATLLLKYGLNKAETGYVSENDDPTRSKSDYTPPTKDDLVNVE
uniref:HVA22 e n=1 Tax=Solanum tuberosum TaxID=4113 RepID=M1CIF2_SOLTU